jgi:hypothetical protein
MCDPTLQAGDRFPKSPYWLYGYLYCRSETIKLKIFASPFLSFHTWRPTNQGEIASDYIITLY